MEEKKEVKKEEEKTTERKEEPITKTEEQLIEERKKKLVNFLKKTNLWVLAFLIIALILGIYIRSLPMSNHSNNVIPSIWSFVFLGDEFFGGRPGLWDIATNTWTLGPDLDPWLFTRYARTIIEQGSLPEIDSMRNVPLGFSTRGELQMVSYMIVLTYKIVNLFGEYNVNFSAALMPVLLFALTIIAFFLFVREIFIRKDKETKTKANIIALISTFFMTVIPTFLSRTVAGIPEKESVAFFFMFLTFYLFLKAWKSEKLKFAVILGILAGISTALMGMAWGGVGYIYITIGTACFLAFILGKTAKKEFVIYVLWFVVSIVILRITSERYSILGFLQSASNLIVTFVLLSMLIHFVLWDTKLKRFFPENPKIPKNLWSVIFSIILGIILVSLFFGIGFIPNKISSLIQTFIKPVTGRWSQTVAENRQPYFTEWGASFGPFIKNIPIMFWLFFIGSIILFKNMLSYLKKKDSWILTGFYVLFLFGLIFSRYAPHPNIFDGEGFVSRVFYFGSGLLLIGSLIYYYVIYYKEKNNGFEKIDYEYLFLFALFVLCLFTARSAVRLIMVLAPIAPIFLGYLIVELIDKFKKTKDSTGKVFLGLAVVLILMLSIFTFWDYYKNVKAQAYSFIPSYYNQQWQKAMGWVRENIAKDAVFAHWWDYGYWIQSIGERATVTDGGNAIVYWNYLSGRLVLTGDNQKDALDFLYSHNATHLLIDSTDIGKYTAFSSIGSDLNYDRYSWIPVMVSDESQMQETRNGIVRVYQGASGIDEDIFYEKDGKEINLPGQSAAIIGITLEISNANNGSLKQPEAVFYYQGVQYKIPLRYLYFNKQFFDFKTGLNATAYVIQRVYQTNQGLKLDNLGALMYLSPRMMRGLFAQKYLLDDPFNNFPNFKLIYSEQNLIVDSLNSQGMGLDEFIFYQGVQGPIKIWEIEYTGKEEIKQEYLDTDASKYIDWQL